MSPHMIKCMPAAASSASPIKPAIEPHQLLLLLLLLLVVPHHLMLLLPRSYCHRQLLRLQHLLLMLAENQRLRRRLQAEAHRHVAEGDRGSAEMGVMQHGVVGVGHGEHGGGADVGGELLLCCHEVVLNLSELVLEDGDEAHAAIDGVTEAGFGLIG